MKTNEKKRIVVEVSGHLHKKIKMKALDKGYTIGQYVLGAILARMGRDD